MPASQNFSHWFKAVVPHSLGISTRPFLTISIAVESLGYREVFSRKLPQ